MSATPFAPTLTARILAAASRCVAAVRRPQHVAHLAAAERQRRADASAQAEARSRGAE